MNGTLVADIKVGEKDFNGNEITAVFGSASKLYAVYRAAHHVFIHYADDDLQGANQRAALTPLAMLRSDVEAAIDRIRARASLFRRNVDAQNLQGKAARKANELEWRLARILLMALQGDDKGAVAQLTTLRDEINEERASEVRSWHLLYAALATLTTILLCWFFSTEWFNKTIHDFSHYQPDYWRAASVGALGALFSIALQLRSRSMPVDLQQWDNICDALLRIFIGASSAIILFALFFGGLVSLQFGDAAIVLSTDEESKIARQIVLAFTAGFTERLVADFVAGFTLGRVSNKPAPTPAAPATDAVRTERDVARGAAANAGGGTAPAPVRRDLPHDPNVPNRIEADDLEDAAALIGGKLDPMEGKV